MHFAASRRRSDVLLLLHALASRSFHLIAILHAALLYSTHRIRRLRLFKAPESHASIASGRQHIARIIYFSRSSLTPTRRSRVQIGRHHHRVDAVLIDGHVAVHQTERRLAQTLQIIAIHRLYLQRNVVQLHRRLLADLQQATALSRLQIPQNDAIISAGSPQSGRRFQSTINKQREIDR